VCGFNPVWRNDYLGQSLTLLNKRTDKCKNALKITATRIKKHIPSQNTSEKQFYFLYKIKDIDDNVIIKVINDYLRYEHDTKGHGYDYLATMINNFGKDKEALKIFERKRYGIPPPERRA
jgi:anaerobic ribonucleoside-triphosphate reductase